MIKTLICFILLMTSAPVAHASDFFNSNATISAFQVNSTSLNILTLLSGYGFNDDDFDTFVKKYPELKDFTLSTTNHYLISEDSESAFGIKIYTDNNQAYVISKTDDDASIEKIETTFNIEIKNIEGTIARNFYDSIYSETNSVKVATIVSEAFAGEFEKSKKSKKTPIFNFQVEEYYDHGHFIKFGNVLNASLEFAHAISKKVYLINPVTKVGSLISENFNLQEKPFYLPVESLRVTSLFQLNRHHPVTRKYQPHNGIDLAVPSGSPVYPALDGVVVTISRTRSKGKYITIRHDNGFLTTYIHLKKFAPGLRVGDTVELGDKIGEVGRTGYTTGSHLHFGVIQDGYFINPIYLLKRYSFNQKDQFEGLAVGIEDKNIDDSNAPEDDGEE